MTEPGWGLRQGENEDGEALAGLVRRVFAEHGATVEASGILPGLAAPEDHFSNRFGRFWVIEQDDFLVGAAGFLPVSGTSGGELRPFLVCDPLRNEAAGARLIALIEAEARRRGESYIEHWADVRLTRQHRLLQDLGFARVPTAADSPESQPLHFRKIL